MRKITVKASRVKQAIELARKRGTGWQGELLEVLRIPNIAKRYNEINTRYPDLKVTYIQGITCPSREEIKSGFNSWEAVRGYTLSYGYEGLTWNSVGSDSRGYSHSPGTAYDGIRRETQYAFAEALHRLTLQAMGEIKYKEGFFAETLMFSRVTFVNDLEGRNV